MIIKCSTCSTEFSLSHYKTCQKCEHKRAIKSCLSIAKDVRGRLKQNWSTGSGSTQGQTSDQDCSIDALLAEIGRSVNQEQPSLMALYRRDRLKRELEKRG